MGITKLRSDTRELGQPIPVPQPVGEPVPAVRTQVVASSTNSRTRNGVWECSPGKFRRVVTQAEFCHFLEGECTFTPDKGESIEIRPGDLLFFPPNSMGVWDIRSTTRKVFVVFDDLTAS
jgi:uncharacterized protein